MKTTTKKPPEGGFFVCDDAAAKAPPLQRRRSCKGTAFAAEAQRADIIQPSGAANTKKPQHFCWGFE
ncbi:hypothetical protein [Zobellella denitrificans]|uniref:hypothetical protein n=1 Tax=Zobellella denitrificans TaxID=347534 RepID=UPI0012FD7146|nr:hypothetical protein [Zobellella denitrificans]